MARHGANYASPRRLDRLRLTQMTRLGTPYCGNKISASMRLAKADNKTNELGHVPPRTNGHEHGEYASVDATQ